MMGERLLQSRLVSQATSSLKNPVYLLIRANRRRVTQRPRKGMGTRLGNELRPGIPGAAAEHGKRQRHDPRTDPYHGIGKPEGALQDEIANHVLAAALGGLQFGFAAGLRHPSNPRQMQNGHGDGNSKQAN